MKSCTGLASVLACIALVSQQAVALPQQAKRQATTSTSATVQASATVDAAAGPTLEPVTPPQQDTSDLDILNPGKSVALAYAGVTTGPLTKRDEAVILANLDLTFKYPSVPLDQSDFITGVECASNGSLSGQITSADAYALVKKSWSPLSSLILITAADSCGEASQNEVFLATSVEFDDDDSSFTATGSDISFHDALNSMDIIWGNTPSDTLSKRFAHDRRDPSDLDDSGSATFDIGIMVSDGIAEAEDPPWPGAVLLASWGPDGDEESTSDKRSLAVTKELMVRGDEGGFDAGLNIYCVDCGIKGSVTIAGGISWTFLSGITDAQVKVSGNIYAGMYLGLEMFAEYTKEWEKDIFKKSLNPWSIPGLVDFGPYVRIAVSAEIEIKAEGTILIGASATWAQFEANLDLISGSSGSSTSGLIPVIDRKAEAQVTLSAEATLGMPLGIGVELAIFGFFTDALSIGCELTETPAIKAQASFEASASIDDGISIGTDTCAGIEWSINLENTLAFTVTGAYTGSYPLDEWESDPLADGCIVIGDGNNNGTDPSDGGSTDPSDGGSTDPSNGGGTDPSSGTGQCAKKNPLIPSDSSCRTVSTGVSDTTYAYQSPSTAKKPKRCAQICLADDQCQSMSWNRVTKMCQMYTTSVSALAPPQHKSKGNLIFSDRSCWAPTECAAKPKQREV